MTDATELIDAAARGRVDDVNELLEKGVDVNANDHEGRPALMLAAATGRSLEILDVLLEAGANINYQSGEGWTAVRLRTLS